MTGRVWSDVPTFGTKSQVLAGGLKELLDREIIDKRIYEWGEELRLIVTLQRTRRKRRFLSWKPSSF